ncbi:helix-turn-helix domain-containing protein [Acuticoccus sediminis]|nr:XRE family transcriptional regulator [Acuticoccus sediminis]
MTDRAERDGPTDVDRLGFKLRDLRRSQALSLQDLSRRADVSVGTLSQLERGLSRPSLRTLQKIGAAAGVPLSWFFDETSEKNEGDGVVVRKGQGAKLNVTAGGISKTLLTPLSVNGLQLMMVTMEPNSASGHGSYTHEGHDAGVVVAGSLNLEVDGRVYVLATGDSFGFDSSLPHQFENRGNTQAQILWVNTQSTAPKLASDADG